ncbi:DEAD/DEAH box helicase [Novosphingobium sp. PY1]|uniref:DEAD/DEAH box helicase domain protein n=1 Tax=Ochrobactrum sp. PW1 TaxID=1882222 RepID=A0A292GS13_9HYPH|nr:DEAD/DEAH box helicase [Novosphingobium sp. PY1]BBA74239.1 DEAD/DEAH box helicase domain protein [Ochrobactrum sp. PW1]GFM29088.1 DEAD/DEAH box helicase domain protein [Novosphingobium sp. PY1]
MAALDEERLALAEQIRQALAIENALTRPQARAYVRCLQTTWQVPAIGWSERESVSQLEDARRLLHAAHIFSTIEGSESSKAIDCYRRTGEILEWLARADDDVRGIVPIELLAAAAYQLGGLPAMASGLLDQIESEHEGVRLYAAFLRADFDRVVERGGAFWQANPGLTGADAANVLFAAMHDEDDAPGFLWTVTIELVRSLGLIADSLRRGDDERLAPAMAKLRAMDDLANRLFSHDAALVIGLMRQVADRYVAASIFTPLRQLAALRPERTGRLLRYARDQFSRNRGILWTSQLHGVDRLLRESSFALCTPTGSGKTLVANLALIKELLLKAPGDGLGSLALYIVPSRALAGEVEAKLSSELRGDVIVTGLYGGADWGITDAWLTSAEPVVLIATVEKADALLRYLGKLLIARLSLLIIDEAHQVVPEASEATAVSFSDHSNRSLRLENLISRILAQRPEVTRIALTAVAGGASGPVARWIEGHADAKAVGVRYRSTRQVIGVLETAPGSSGQILLDLMNGKPLYLRGQENPVYLPLRFAPMPLLPSQWRNSLNHFNSLSVLWTALHLAQEDQRILISVAQEPEQTMRWLSEALALGAWEAIVAFERPEGILGDRFDEARAACLDYCGADSFELFLLDRGIATSHGQMPQRLRRLMVGMIDRKICPITVATATLTEGVNLPFDLIFLTSLKRRSWDPVKEEPIIAPFSTSEFRNLAGRAGRPGAARGIEGMTLVALPTRISTTAPSMEPRASRPVQERQLREWTADYEDLTRRLLAEEQEADAAESPLALLLTRIWRKANELLGVAPDAFMGWLERTAPGTVSFDAGTGASDPTSRLADAMDELDSVLLTALAENERDDEAAMTPARAEEQLRVLWAKTFTAVATAQEAWLEAAFIRRGSGIIGHIYPDAGERQRLYQYGFTPWVGRRFEAVAAQILALIAGALDYGALDAEGRVDLFEAIGNLLEGDKGFGFRVRPTLGDRALLDRWNDVLVWWMNEPGANGPDAENLRAWQRFVADNLEFRLGVAIGAVVAKAWSDGAPDATTTPTLADWKQTAGLPWFGFWARELLRWGTHDPFVAFCLAQGLARTREAATARRPEFDAWLEDDLEEPDSEDRIDPQLFQRWQASLPRRDASETPPELLSAELTGTLGHRQRYAVIPIKDGDRIRWLDPAGFELAVSAARKPDGRNLFRSDFELRTTGPQAAVVRSFRPA